MFLSSAALLPFLGSFETFMLIDKHRLKFVNWGKKAGLTLSAINERAVNGKFAFLINYIIYQRATLCNCFKTNHYALQMEPFMHKITTAIARTHTLTAGFGVNLCKGFGSRLHQVESGRKGSVKNIRCATRQRTHLERFVALLSIFLAFSVIPKFFSCFAFRGTLLHCVVNTYDSLKLLVVNYISSRFAVELNQLFLSRSSEYKA